MKHVINTKTRTCTQCGKLLGDTIRDTECHGTAAQRMEEEIRNEPRMKRADNALEEAKQFTDKLKALGEELGFTVIEVKHPDEDTEPQSLTDLIMEMIEAFHPEEEEVKPLPTLGDLIREIHSTANGTDADELLPTLSIEEFQLLKMLVDHPMPTNHIGVLQLPFDCIEMMCVFKRNDLIMNRGPIGNSYWHVTTKGLDAITEYNKPKAIKLTIDQLCTLIHIYHADTWDAFDVLDYQAEQDVSDLMAYGLVKYRRMTNDWVLTEAGVTHVQKILALTV